MSLLNDVKADFQKDSIIGNNIITEKQELKLDFSSALDTIGKFDYAPNKKFTNEDMNIIRRNMGIISNVLKEGQENYLVEKWDALEESTWSKMKDNYWYKMYKSTRTQYIGKIEYINEHYEDAAMYKSLNNFLTTYEKNRTEADKKKDNLRKILSKVTFAAITAGMFTALAYVTSAASTPFIAAFVPIYALLTGMYAIGVGVSDNFNEFSLLAVLINKICSFAKFGKKGLEIKQSDGKFKTYVQLEHEALVIIDRIYHESHEEYVEKHKMKELREDLDKLTKSMDYTHKEIQRAIEKLRKAKPEDVKNLKAKKAKA